MSRGVEMKKRQAEVRFEVLSIARAACVLGTAANDFYDEACTKVSEAHVSENPTFSNSGATVRRVIEYLRVPRLA
jgi:hypothetical protein